MEKNKRTADTPDEHPFLDKPHWTIITLSIPVTLSVIAEPITGMVDTGFIAQLGTAPLAALGVGTAALSTIFWIFNFLGISTQTEVARTYGKQKHERATELMSLALIMAGFLSVMMILLCLPNLDLISRALGAADEVLADASTYLSIRLFGAPAVMGLFICFGALRGLQDMRTPLYIAVGINILNILLDSPLIFGFGPIPPLGVAGAAIASTISQWVGVLWGLAVVVRRLGFVWHIDWGDIRALLRVGGDLFVRTGMLTLFILISTRVANQISPEAGAAHQSIRTVWMFLSMMMEGFAVTTQSLVGYFLGAAWVDVARRSAALAMRWGLGVSVGVMALMLVGTPLVIAVFIPPDSVSVFGSAWVVAALIQPLAALAFVTDGIHWGTGDYAFLRNGMLTATITGGAMLFMINQNDPNGLLWVWIATAVWIGIRAFFGTVRVWPGLGHSPLRPAQKAKIASAH